MRILAIAIALAVVHPVQAAPLDELAQLSWMAGDWRETKGAVTTRETWSPTSEAMMTGRGWTEPESAGGQEAMVIRPEAGRLVFAAQSPGQPETLFTLRKGADGEAVFENLGHDFPQRVIYRRCGDDLCARIEGVVAGKLQGRDWRYSRMK